MALEISLTVCYIAIWCSTGRHMFKHVPGDFLQQTERVLILKGNIRKIPLNGSTHRLN